MACKIDHSTLIGIKFCTECGAAVENAQRRCVQGHELVRGNKFCEVCGGPEFVAGATPTPPGFSTPAPIYSPVSGATTPNTFDSPFPGPAATPPKKKLGVMIGAAVLALLIAGGFIFNATKTKYTAVAVSMHIYGQNCYDLSWGYSDIPNGQVILSVDGEQVSTGYYGSTGLEGGTYCTFSTVLSHVPMNGDNYVISMGSGLRGTVSNSRSEMESNDWDIVLSLGL